MGAWVRKDPWVGKIPWRRAGHLQYPCLENPHRQRSLVRYSPLGCKESDKTEWSSTQTGSDGYLSITDKLIGKCTFRATAKKVWWYFVSGLFLFSFGILNNQPKDPQKGQSPPPQQGGNQTVFISWLGWLSLRLDAWDKCSGAGALGRPRGMGWGGRREGWSGWGTHVNPWLIHVNVWPKPLQCCKVISLQLIKINEKKLKKKKERESPTCFPVVSTELLFLNSLFR